MGFSLSFYIPQICRKPRGENGYRGQLRLLVVILPLKRDPSPPMEIPNHLIFTLSRNQRETLGSENFGRSRTPPSKIRHFERQALPPEESRSKNNHARKELRSMP
ncbi:uncharacterized protein LOC111372859 [Olea europaea var. sylvestris]|uniref:uncharacterized protein LOC111372859 n=1 Tax=Olea europaea var. sylvestris TaxID=158386 RepID=UPI000C1D2C16|nr:uncharacterized protein LOC111372859 [Olea europaea var. sylvestris]